jgi:hypothetical protein
MRRTVTIGLFGLENSTFGPRKLGKVTDLIFKLCGFIKAIAHNTFELSNIFKFINGK